MKVASEAVLLMEPGRSARVWKQHDSAMAGVYVWSSFFEGVDMVTVHRCDLNYDS
jgi:hypothetical protein